MSDMFHAQITDEFIEQVWNTMAAAPQHTFQILTKMPAGCATEPTAYRYCPTCGSASAPKISGGPRSAAPVLLDTPAAVRFISAEPLPTSRRIRRNSTGVIVGGESGPNYRPMNPDWARDLRYECTSAGVAFLFKLLGTKQD